MLFLFDVQNASAAIPSKQAKYVTFSNVTSSAMTISWVRGGVGDGVIVLVRNGAKPDVSTLGEDKSTVGWGASNTYTGTNTIATNSGDLVYKNTGTSVTVSGLSASTTYYVMVLEYNNDGSNNVDIQNSTASFNPRDIKTLSATLLPPSGLALSAKTASTATITWTDNGSVGYYLDVQDENKEFYPEYDLLDVGTSTTTLVTGLNANKTSRFRLRSYDAQGKTSAASAWFNIATLENDPDVSAIKDLVKASSVCGFSFDLQAVINNSGEYPGIEGTWTGTGINSGNQHSLTPTVTVSAAGEYKYTFTINVGLYYASDTYTVTYKNTPTATAGSDDNAICDEFSYQLSGDMPDLGETGTWTCTSGNAANASFVNANLYNTTVNVTAFGDYTFKWDVSNGVCHNNLSEVIITFTEQPTASAGSTPATHCSLNGFQLDGNNPSVGTGEWTMTSAPSGGSATFYAADGITPNSTVYNGKANVSVEGTYEFTWTVTNGACSDYASVSVMFYAPASAATITNPDPPTVCGNTLTLDGNTPTVGSGSWTVTPTAGITITNPTSPTSNVTVATEGTWSFTWTIKTANCPAQPVNIAIKHVTFKQQPVANAGSPISVCEDLFTTLAAVPSAGTGSWTLGSGSAGTATFTPATSATATANVSTHGVYYFVWTETNGTCTDNDVVTATFYEMPWNDAGSSQSFCASSGGNLDADAPGVGSGLWTTTETGISITDPSSPTSGVTVTAPFSGASKTFYFTWTTTNGICSDDNDADITFYNAPTTADAGVDINACGTSTSLNGNNPTIGSGSWTQVGGSDATITTPTSNVSGVSIPSISGASETRTFRWTITNGQCTDYNDVDVTFFKSPSTADASGTPANVCGKTVGLVGNTPTIGTGAWSTIGDATITGTNATLNSDLGPSESHRDVSFTWTITNGPVCTPSTNSTSVRFWNNPTTANAGTDQTQTGASITLAGNDPTVGGVGTGSWSWVSGHSVSITTPSSPTSGVTTTFGAENVRTAVLRWTITNVGSPCGVSTDDVTVTFQKAPANHLAIDYTGCTLPENGKLQSGQVYTIKVESHNNDGLREPNCDKTITITPSIAGSPVISYSGSRVITSSMTSVTFSFTYTLTNGAGNANPVVFTVSDDAGTCSPVQDLTDASFTKGILPGRPLKNADRIRFGQTGIPGELKVYWWDTGSGLGTALWSTDALNNGALSYFDGTNIFDVDVNTSPVTFKGANNAVINQAGNKYYVVYRSESHPLKDTVVIKGFTLGTVYRFRLATYNFDVDLQLSNAVNTYKYTSDEPDQSVGTRKCQLKLGTFNGIEVSDLRGHSYDAKAELNWEAFREDGLSGYEIYRNDPTVSGEFVKINDVNVKTASGKSNIYNMIDNDNSLKVGNTYTYRLVGVGFDGQTYDLSEVDLTILTMPNTDVSLFVSEINPNPVKDVVRFNVQTVKSAPVIVEIRNSIGQVVFTEERTINGISNFEYNMNNKAAGSYYITVVSGSEALLTTFVLVP